MEVCTVLQRSRIVLDFVILSARASIQQTCRCEWPTVGDYGRLESPERDRPSTDFPFNNLLSFRIRVRDKPMQCRECFVTKENSSVASQTVYQKVCSDVLPVAAV